MPDFGFATAADIKEVVTVVVGGRAYTAWKKVTLRASFKEACRSFTLIVAAEGGGAQTAAVFQLGTPLRIYAGDDLVMAGYVNGRTPHLQPRDAHIIITGRSKSQDAVDCSAIHPTGTFKGKTPAEIGQALDQFGIGIKTNRMLDAVDYQITPGESVWDAVEGLCRDQMKTVTGLADGSMLITDATQSDRHAGGLVEGVNIEEATADHNDGSRHSEVKLRGQSRHGHGKAALKMEATAADGAVKRHRPLLVVHDGEIDHKRLGQHAKHHRDRAAGNALRAVIATPSWRDDGGKLWTPGYRIWSSSPFLDLQQDMLLEGFNLEQDDKRGTMAFLELCDPQAFGGKAGKGDKSGAGWAIGEDG